MKYLFLIGILATTLYACNGNKVDMDASGNFETDELIVSAEQNGKILQLDVEEGSMLKVGQMVGQIDVTIPNLQKEQAIATITALREKTVTDNEQVELVKKQLAVQTAQLEQQQREKVRTENLIKSDAATRKQLDDINAAIDQLEKQINVTKQQIRLYNSNTATQNRSVLSERAPLEKTVEQYEEQIRKGRIINPGAGTVLSKYAFKGELTSVGRPLYKIANLDTIYLKAYVTGAQLPAIRVGQAVTVLIDQDKNSSKEYAGTISWISNKSEFTPKTIQTKDERANLVYAIKVRVKNDGFLKIGMYGEVRFTSSANK